MGAPMPEIESAEEASAGALLDSLKTIPPAERRKHASIFNYWLSIRGEREFPPIRDLDPLEISDAGPFSTLLEMIGGGEDAEIRHIGQAIKGDFVVEKVGDAPSPSLLSCIASRLPVVAACREAFAFEDAFEAGDGRTRCWVTLLPFSATGTWIDYVYGFVSLDPAPGAEAPAPAAEEAPAAAEEPSEIVAAAESFEPEAVAPAPEPFEERQSENFAADEPEPEQKPGFSKKIFDSLASVKGFYGHSVDVDLDLETAELTVEQPAEAPVAEAEEAIAPAEQELAPAEEEDPAPEEQPVEIEPSVTASEGTLQTKLTEVRAKADEARAAKLRANAALYEGLSAAYDFALDAEDAPEDYLRLVEAQGLKIQLRSPMKPVVKLAFDGMCDDATIKQLEAILAWAFDEELPRGTLAERIEAEGGIAPILTGQKRAA